MTDKILDVSCTALLLLVLAGYAYGFVWLLVTLAGWLA